MGYDDDILIDESSFLWLIKTHLITGSSWFVIVSNTIAENTTVKQNTMMLIHVHHNKENIILQRA